MGLTAEFVCYLLALIPLKQLSGYSYLRTIANVVMAVALMLPVIVVVLFVLSFIFFA